MTTAQVVETSVTVNNSPIQDYVHPDDQTQPTFTVLCQSVGLYTARRPNCSYKLKSSFMREGRIIQEESHNTITCSASNDTRNGVWTVKTSKKMNEVSFKGKSEETAAKSNANLRGKASGWLRHNGNLNWSFTKKSGRRHKLTKCFYSRRINYLISFIPFLVSHNFTIWSPWNALVCFQTSSLPFTRKSKTQNFHSLTMVCFQRLTEQETEDEYENKK